MKADAIVRLPLITEDKKPQLPYKQLQFLINENFL